MSIEDTIIETLTSWIGLDGSSPDKNIRIKHANIVFPNDSLQWALFYADGWVDPKTRY